MKLKHLLLLPVLIAATGYAGIKGYVHYKVQSQLDELVTLASPFASIEYAGISSELDGVLGIEGIRISPLESHETVTLHRITVEGDGLAFLFALADGFKKQPPKKLKFRLFGAEVPVGGEMVSSFGLSEKYKPAPCSLAGIFQHTNLDALGYTTVSLDSTVDFVFDEEVSEVGLGFDYQLEGIESLKMSAEIRGVTNPAMVAMGTMPSVGDVSITYQVEPEYMQQVVKHCAEREGVVQQLFINSLFEKEQSYYLKNLGFVPGPGLMGVLKELLTQAGKMRIQVLPAVDITSTTLNSYRPEDLVSMLGLELSVNDKQVTDLSFALDAKAASSSAREGQKGQSSSTSQRSKSHYVLTAVEDLEGYLGYPVRVLTKDSEKPKLGLLDSVEAERFGVVQRLYGGSMTALIRYDNVQRVEVLRRE